MTRLTYFYSLIIVLLICVGDQAINLAPSSLFAPSQQSDHEDITQNQNLRKKWFDHMHSSAPDVDWKAIEYHNQRKDITPSHQIQLREDCQNVMIERGQIQGYWNERGSVNQAGSILEVTYDPNTDKLWLISDGGSLLRGSRTGNDWVVVNDQLRFSAGLLEVISWKGKTRLLAMIGRTPHFSDNGGHSWQPATGIEYLDQTGSYKDPKAFKYKDILYCYLLVQPQSGMPISLFVSNDGGEQFFLVRTYSTDDLDHIMIEQLHYDKHILVSTKSPTGTRTLSRFDPVTQQAESLPQDTAFNFGLAPVNLVGSVIEDKTSLYSYRIEEPHMDQIKLPQLYYSDDWGANWKRRGPLYSFPWEALPSFPWGVGLYQSPDNPQILYYGEVECFKSSTGGKDWGQGPINYYGRYYQDPSKFLHADIMNIKAFKTIDETPFQVIANHGGISISYDEFQTQLNIGLMHLNVSQYYDVKTLPTNPDFIFAGSQDQGLQRSDQSQSADMLSFEQTVPGDFGQLVFTNKGEYLWAIYPGSLIYYLEDPINQISNGSFQLPFPNEEVWLAPLMEDPLSSSNAVIIGGGSLTKEGESHLIRVYLENGQVIAEQLSFDFARASAGGQISALATSSINPKLWFVITTNGYFFYSADGGNSWTPTSSKTLAGRYFYGTKILPSNQKETEVIIAGSGYSNPAILKSDDFGYSFTAYDNGLPATLVYDLEATPNEQFLFAATEAGPYVYTASSQTWHLLSQACAPNQAYWSVEWLEKKKIARFGTYGRGIWDFNVSSITSNQSGRLAASLQINIYPNPVREQLFIRLNTQIVRAFTSRNLEQPWSIPPAICGTNPAARPMVISC